MVAVKHLLAAVVVVCGATAAHAQTNLSVAWRICEQHGKTIGRPNLTTGPSRIVFAPGYALCEEVQKSIPTMKTEVLDPSKVVSDMMLIQRGITDPNGAPK